MNINRYTLSTCLLMTLGTQAATISWVGGSASNDWNDAANWSSAYLPGATEADTVLFVGTDDNTTLVTPFTFTNASSINLRSDGGPTVTLNADLSGVNTLYLAGNSGHDGGTINQLGGTLSTVSVRVGSSSGATTESFYTMTGGRLANSGDLVVNKGSFTLSGSSAAVETDALTVTSIGTLSFVLGSDGVTPISVTNAFTINDSTSRLTIDASAYTATNSTIELLQFGSLNGSFAASEITVTGLRPDQEPASIFYDDNRMTLELAKPDPNWAAMLALGDLTNAPAIYDIYGTSTTWSAVAAAATGAVQAIYYDGLDYLGNPTRVFAYVKLPANASAANPVPGVVLVHGGGGTAYPDWVEKWADRGYAAIAMDNEGDAFDPQGNEIDSPYPGPHRTGIYKDSEPENLKPLDEQWEYHATATVILANSLLRAMSEVDADKVGVTGVSWGGVLTSTAIGIDDRFAFAVPVYGCGRLFDVGNQYGAALGDNVFYQTILDPILRMDRATMPQLWCSWPGENNFSLDSQAATYLAGTNAEHSVALVPGMGHGHGASYNRPEPYDFADHVLATGTLWGKQESLSRIGDAVEVVFASTKPLYNATLIYTTGTGYTGDLDWPEMPADSLVDNADGTWTVQATLPTNTTAWFVNVNALGSDVDDLYNYKDVNLYMSSDYQEVINVTLSPDIGFEMSHPITLNQSTGMLQVDCTVPTNLEIVEIRAADESHPGSLTYPGAYPVVLVDGGLLSLEFDNTVAGLASGETATGMVQVVWENMDGSTDVAELPFTVTARAAQTVVYDATTNWTSKTVYEIDDVFIQSNATVTLDQEAVAGTLRISDGHLLMDQNYTLTLADSLTVETNGSLSVLDGELDFNGGSFVVDGSVIIDGGTANVETLALSGTGSLLVKSGALNFNSGSTLDISLLEISGGSVDFGSGSAYVGDNGSTELRVVGDTASISMNILNLQPWTSTDPTLRFVLNETGVSTIQVSSFMNLPQAAIIVDGSAYTGGAGNFVLIDSANLATLGDTNKFSATGFEAMGLNAVVVQDQTNGKDWVELVLTETAYGSWVRGFNLSGADLRMTANPDGDAYSNGEEFIAGLNPGVFDAFEIQSFSNGDTLEWDAVSGRLYNVYWASNLVDGFTLIGSNVVDGIYTDSESNAQGFYKITVELAP
ncbi:dienelactone hydrolase family protein [Pontiellaceae bacterium B12219]|nr:dienelactone hydrolase family protein [Pontiellaceae bacterium B12219]